MPSTPSPSSPVLLLPGWLDSGPAHWQSRWQVLHGHDRVTQDDWHWPRRGDWMARLDDEVQRLCPPQAPRAVLVAHSLGCLLVAAWAAHSRHIDRVACAMLVAPPDTEREDMPPNLFNWRPLPRKRLPFPSLVISSSNDPYCDGHRAADLAADWGSQHSIAGALGHINDESGLGDWPEGHQQLLRLMAASA
jgi:uncharacterized protein